MYWHALEFRITINLVCDRSNERHYKNILIMNTNPDCLYINKNVRICFNILKTNLISFFTSMFLKEMEVWWWQKKSCSRLLQILIVLPSKHEKKSFFEKCLCVYLSVCLSVDFFMANDNSRKFKQNQIFFCIPSWIVEFSKACCFWWRPVNGCLLYTSRCV